MKHCKMANAVGQAALAFLAFTYSGWAEEPAKTIAITNIHIPSKAKLGYYGVCAPREPLNFTVSDAMKVPADTKYKRHELIDHVSYPQGKVLAIVLDGDASPVNERLSKLRSIPVEDIHHLGVFGELDKVSLEIIATYRNLRQLTIEPSPILETAEGARLLQSMSNLEYLFLLETSQQAFGNRLFCEAIGRMKALQYVSFPADGLTNAQAQLIASSNTLQSVQLHTKKAMFSGVTLRAFQRVKSLRELVLFCTDDIVAEDLNGFSELKDLEILAIQSEADPTIADSLKRLLPDCSIGVFPPAE